MNATVTIDHIDHTEHTLTTYTVAGEFDHGHVGSARALAVCSCGWRGTPVAAGNEAAQWNQHVGVGER